MIYSVPNRLHVITIQQQTEWRDVINRSIGYDFYHTWHYHSLNRSGEPILIVYECEGDFIAFPFIRRCRNSSECYLASVYGYTGPVSNKKFRDWNVLLLQDFEREFILFFKNNGYSSVTSRLHPFIDQENLLKRFGGEIKEGKSVAIDLSTTIEGQRKGYRRNLWGYIKKLRRQGYYVKEGSPNDIHSFISIYWENMRRVGADEVYFFDEQYFLDFIASEDFDARLFFVFLGTEAVCASLVTFTNGVIQGYLIGTRGQYLSESPAKLLVDQVSVVGREQGMKYYNLGGGLNFEEDQLFKWKSGFSRSYFNSDKWTFRPFKGAKH